MALRLLVNRGSILSRTAVLSHASRRFMSFDGESVINDSFGNTTLDSNKQLSAIVRTEKANRTYHVIRDMLDSNVAPDEYTLNIFLKSVRNRPSRGLSIIEGFKQLGVTPNVITFKQILGSCRMKKDMDTVAGLFEVFKSTEMSDADRAHLAQSFVRTCAMPNVCPDELVLNIYNYAMERNIDDPEYVHSACMFALSDRDLQDKMFEEGLIKFGAELKAKTEDTPNNLYLFRAFTLSRRGDVDGMLDIVNKCQAAGVAVNGGKADQDSMTDLLYKAALHGDDFDTVNRLLDSDAPMKASTARMAISHACKHDTDLLRTVAGKVVKYLDGLPLGLAMLMYDNAFSHNRIDVLREFMKLSESNRPKPRPRTDSRQPRQSPQSQVDSFEHLM